MRKLILLLFLFSPLIGYSQLKTFRVLGYRQCQYNPIKGEWGKWGQFYKTIPEFSQRIAYIDYVKQKIVIDSIILRIIPGDSIYSSIGFEPNSIAYSTEYPCLHEGDTISFALVNSKFDNKIYFDLVFRENSRLQYLVEPLSPEK